MDKIRKIVLFVALVMIFGIISVYIPSDYAEASSTVGEEMDIRLAPSTDDLEKVWHIKFNKGIKEGDLDSLYGDFIFVEGPLGEIHKTTLSLQEGNNKVVLVTPDKPYENNKPYTLYVLKGFENAEDSKVINKTVKMDFTVEAEGDVTIDTQEYPDNKRELKDKVIYGDLIIDGGGEVVLTNVEVKGKIIVNDISENSLVLDKVKADKIEVNDTNGARIFVKEGNISEHNQEVTKIGLIEINARSTQPIKLKGDFSSATINVNQPIEIEVSQNTNIKEINIKEEGSKITPEEGVELVNIIGSITGSIPEEIKEIKEQIDNNKINFDELNAIPHESREETGLYLQRGKDMQLIIEKILGPNRLGEDYKDYPEHTRIRTANSIRSLRKNVEITTIAQLEKLFNDAIRWNRIFNEGMKYAAYHDQREANENYEWPIISKDIEIGADITDIVMKLAEGVTEEQLNKEITVELLSLEDLKEHPHYESLARDYEFFDIDKLNNTVKLTKLNNRNQARNLSIMVHIADDANNSGSLTNFILTLEPQAGTIDEVNLSTDNDETIRKIDNNNRLIITDDNILVGDFLTAIESSTTGDLLKVVDSNYVKVNDTNFINGSMMLEITRGENRAYYKIIARPIIRSNDLNVIKEVSLDRWAIVVHPGKTIEDVRLAVDTNHDYYELDMWYKNGEKITDLSKLVDNNMELVIETGTIETGNSGFGFSIEVYIGEVHLSIRDKSIVEYINNKDQSIDTYDDIKVEDFLYAIESDNRDDYLNVVDSNNEVVAEDSIVNISMKLEINRGGNKAYYRIYPRPVIDTKDKNIVKEVIDNYRIIVIPGNTAGAVQSAIKTNYDYKFIFRDKDKNELNPSVSIEEVDRIYINGFGFKIEVFTGDVYLSSNDEFIIQNINNEDKRIYTYDDIKVEDFLAAIETDNANDVLKVIDLNNVEVDKVTNVTNAMKLEINREGSKIYYSIGAIPTLEIANDNNTIKEVIRPMKVIVFPEKTVKEVIKAIETPYGDYKLSIRDNNRNILNEDEIVEENMKLLVDTGNGSFGFSIRIYNEEETFTQL